MKVLEELQRAGLTVEAIGGRLRASPADRITPECRRLIVQHKALLLAALGGQHAEVDRGTIRTAATAGPEWLEARNQLHGHIFNCQDCHPPTGRYCATGTDLRARYCRADWSAPS